jgi:chromosome partitioning protein
MPVSDSAVIPQDDVLTSARPAADRAGQRFVILLANAKGGCGKTTLSTSLASYYAGRGRDVTLLDLDPQQSASQWCRQRQQGGHDDIRLLSLPLDSRFHAGKLQSSLREAGELLIIDSPAGLDGSALDALLNISRVVLVPVLPSPIDIRAATRFMQAVMLSPANRRRPKRLAVIANRARERTRMYTKLELFLGSLKIPFLATLRDTQLYVRAAGDGCGVLDLHEADQQDREAWRTIIEWLEVQRHLSRAIPGL